MRSFRPLFLFVVVLCAIHPTLVAEKLKAAALLPAIATVESVQLVDINRDGKPDLIYSGSNATQQAIAVQLGNGDGTYQPALLTVLPANTPTNLCCSGVFTLADVNGDGSLDVLMGATYLVANTNSSTPMIAVLLGRGDGTFGAVQFSRMNLDHPGDFGYPGADGRMAVGDWNGDGHLDLSFTDPETGVVGVALGDGAGNFTQVNNYKVGEVVLQGTQVVDLNGDGHPDFLVQILNTNESVAYLNTGGGNFTQVTTPLLNSIESILAADVNGDGKPDVIVTGSQPPDYVSLVYVALGNGDGTFQTPVLQGNYSGSNPRVVQFIDMNGDGYPDIFMTTDAGAAYLKGDGHGDFSGLIEISTGPWSYNDGVTAIAADVTNDGLPDVVSSGPAHGQAGIVLATNYGGDQFDTADLYDTVSQFANLAVADLNRDGFSDVLASTPQPSATILAPTLYLGQPSGTLAEQGVATTPVSSQFLSSLMLGDVNGDGKLDLLGGGGYNPVTWQPGNGDGTFGDPASLPGTTDSSVDIGIIAIRDFNGDGYADVLLQGSAVSPFLDEGSAAGPVSGIPFNNSMDVFSHIFVDLNGDGLLDYVYTDGSSVFVALANTPTTFSAPVAVLTANNGSILVADLDLDGKPDLVIAAFNSSNVYQDQVLYGKGDGTFEGAVTLPLPAGTTIQAVADFNLDGHNDLVLTDESYLYILHGTGARTYEAIADMYPSAITPANVQVADFNGDGSPDVLVSSTLSSFVVHLNRGGTRGDITTDPSGPVYGQGATIAISVSESVPHTGTPSGQVSVAVDGTALGTFQLAAVSTGTASGSQPQAPLLGAGTHIISAQYAGDGTFNRFTFRASETVSKATTTVALTASPLTLVAGESIAVSAAVTPEYSGVPTGAVNFSSGSTQLATANLNGSATAATSVSSLAAGNYSLVANYVGDANFLPGVSSSSPVIVTDFSLSVAPAVVDLTTATSGSATLTLTAINGFTNVVNVSCSAPSPVTCTSGAGTLTAAGSTSLTVSRSASAALNKRSGRWAVLACMLPLMLLRRRSGLLLTALVMVSAITAIGCGGGGGGGGSTNPITKTYSVTVQGTLSTDATITRTTTFSVVVPQN